MDIQNIDEGVVIAGDENSGAGCCGVETEIWLYVLGLVVWRKSTGDGDAGSRRVLLNGELCSAGVEVRGGCGRRLGTIDGLEITGAAAELLELVLTTSRGRGWEGPAET